MLVVPDDMFEVKRVPNVLLQGPTLVENGARRTMGLTYLPRTKFITLARSRPAACCCIAGKYWPCSD